MAVAWGAEERQPARGRPSRVGSRFFVSEMAESARRNLAVYVNLDMVGHGDQITCGRLNVGPRGGTQRCVSEAQRLGFDAVEKELPDWSDHGPFQQAGLNAAWVWTGDVACCYHNARDTIDNIRQEDLRRSAELALAIVRSYSAERGG
jgi:aminopeptidase YwaD